jgi:hypothetical protein
MRPIGKSIAGSGEQGPSPALSGPKCGSLIPLSGLPQRFE